MSTDIRMHNLLHFKILKNFCKSENFSKQCRCYNTTNIMCSRFRVYEPAAVELPSEMQIFPTSSKQAVLAHVVPISISELSIDPLCCVVGDCPVWIKCKNPVKVRQDQPGIHGGSKLKEEQRKNRWYEKCPS